MFKRMLLLWGLALLITACSSHEYTATVLDNPRPVENFTLTAHTGEDISLAETNGKWRVVYFGFTYCPDVCPTTLFEMRRAWEELGSTADEFQFYMISVDPQRDTQEALGEYMTNFHPSFVGLRTDDQTQLSTIAEQFMIFYDYGEATEDDPNTYDVFHSEGVMVLNPAGELVAVFPSGIAGDVIAADLRALLRSE